MMHAIRLRDVVDEPTELEDLDLTHPRGCFAPRLERSAPDQRVAAPIVESADASDMGPIWLGIPAVDAQHRPSWLPTLHQAVNERKPEESLLRPYGGLLELLQGLGVRFRQLIFVGDTDRAGLDAASPTRLGPALIEPDTGTATAHIEILDMRGTGLSTAIVGRIRMPLGPTVRDRRGCPAMSVHQVDVALSAGRQAVERARLQQTALLVAQTVGSDCRTLTLGQQLARHPSPYQTLRHHGGLEHAALTGAALAAAQLGLPLILAGPAARIAAGLAIAINAPAADWVLYAR